MQSFKAKEDHSGMGTAKNMNNKKQSLLRVCLPTPVDWLIIAPIFFLFLVNPFHFLERMMDSKYLWIYNILGFLIFLPYYRRLKIRINKYQENKWDQ